MDKGVLGIVQGGLKFIICLRLEFYMIVVKGRCNKKDNNSQTNNSYF